MSPSEVFCLAEETITTGCEPVGTFPAVNAAEGGKIFDSRAVESYDTGPITASHVNPSTCVTSVVG